MIVWEPRGEVVVPMEVWDEEDSDETERDCIFEVIEAVASDSDRSFRDDGCLDFFFCSRGLVT